MQLLFIPWTMFVFEKTYFILILNATMSIPKKQTNKQVNNCYSEQNAPTQRGNDEDQKSAEHGGQFTVPSRRAKAK